MLLYINIRDSTAAYILTQIIQVHNTKQNASFKRNSTRINEEK